MNKQQENKLTMYEAVLSLLGANSDKTGTVTAFAPAITEMTTLVTQLKTTAQRKDQATVGKVDAKNQAEDDLLALLMPVAGALVSYARRQKDAELKAKANVTESELRRMRDTELVTRAQAIHALATTNVASLADFGVTAAKLTDLSSKISTFNVALGARESSVAERAGMRANMGTIYEQIDEVLAEDIDQLIEHVRQSYPEFYNQYLSVRVIKDIGIRHEAEKQPSPAPPTPA